MQVPGLPQSATGQTALLTGINAAQAAGGHREGFPGAELQEIIIQHNLFRRLRDRGYRCAFANAYYLRDRGGRIDPRRMSVTTVATLAGIGWVRDETYLERDEAVYQDLTRRVLRERGYTGRLISPEEAAGHLEKIAWQHDFTLFEFFQTDRAGHAQDREMAARVLRELERFLVALRDRVRQAGGLLLITSDHGNIEDLGCATHTRNPVPFFAEGPGAEQLMNGIRCLEEVTARLLKLYPSRQIAI